MAMPYGYQLYGLYLSYERVYNEYNQKGSELFVQFEELGLTVQMFYSKNPKKLSM